MKDRTAIAVWALLVGAYATALWIAGSDSLEPALLSGAAVGGLAVAALASAVGGGGKEPRTLPDSSLPTVMVVFGLVMMLNAFAFGLWLALLGAELAGLGAYLLVREMRRGADR
ncbi:MAG: hypothetical protein ACR2K6_09490 [Solirubrobacterales bacterium]